VVQVVELLPVLVGVIAHTIRFNELGRDHARDDGEHCNDSLDLAVAICDHVVLVAHQVEKARNFYIFTLDEVQQTEQDDLVIVK